MIDSIYLVNTVTLQSVLIDRDDSQFVLDQADLGTVKGTHHSYKYVNQVGVYINTTTLEQRTVSIKGWVIGDTYGMLEENKSILNKLVNPLHYMDVQISEKYKLTFRPDYSIKYSAPYKDNNEVLCKFLIQGTCADPMFTTVGKQGAMIGTIPKFHFPLIIPKNKGILMGLRTSSLFLNLYNQGDISTGFVAEFTCTSSVQNPKLINVDTQEYIQLNKTIAADEKVIVSTVGGEKYVKGIKAGVESNYFQYFDYESSWMQLNPGLNILKYDADDNVTGLEVSVTFLPKLLEVQ